MDENDAGPIRSMGSTVPKWAVGVALVAGLIVGGLIGFRVGERPIVQEVVRSDSPLSETTNTDPTPTTVAEEASDTTEAVETTTTQVLDTDPLRVFVSPSGDDSADGQTEATPFATMQRAVEALEAGMTLVVMPGTHVVEGEGPTLIPVVRNGDESTWTRIIGSEEERPVIIARGGALFEALGSYIEFSGLELRGEGFGPDQSYGYGILFGDGHHFRAVNNVVSGFPVSGIGAVRTSHLYIANNWVFENSNWGTEQGSGMGVFHATNYGFSDDEFGYSDYFINNVIYRNENLVTSRFVPGQITDGNGIIIDNGDETGYLGRTLIANNLIYDNGGRAIWAFASSRVDIFNNTAINNVTTGDALNGALGEIATVRGSDVRIANNIAVNETGMETFIITGPSGIVANANLYDGVLIYEGEGVAPLLDELPEIVMNGMDPALLVPDSGSQLVDAGQEIPLPLDVDLLGSPRRVGSSIDIGAFEVG